MTEPNAFEFEDGRLPQRFMFAVRSLQDFRRRREEAATLRELLPSPHVTERRPPNSNFLTKADDNAPTCAIRRRYFSRPTLGSTRSSVPDVRSAPDVSTQAANAIIPALSPVCLGWAG